MEIIGINVCRTCLGKLDEVPRNVLEANFTDVLDVLRGFVADLADFRTDDIFNVCSFCYEKLDYICKFKRQCQKSYDDYMEIKNKKVSLSEDPVASNLGQIIDDDYLSAKIELDSVNLEETITIYKNSEETKSTAMGPLEPTMEPLEPTMVPLEPTMVPLEPIISSARRGSRAKQFPTSDVLVAIDECTSYQTDLKNRKCIHCDHLAKINRQLCIHMKYKHAEEVRTWCSRCNTQTNDLEEHLKATRCCEYVCKFCNKKCRRLFMLMAHLKSHAFEHFAAQSKKAKISSQREISEHKALAFPAREDSQQEKSLQQLSNVVFQYDNTVVDAVIKMDSTTIDSSTNIATADGKIKASRISKQYDSALVLQALAQCTNYLRNMKNRICGQCSVVTTLSTGLNNHMLRTHSKLYPFWCNRCNVQTEDLQAHKDLVKCNTYSCKFCDKEFNKLNKLSKHLQCHCHEIFRNKATVDEEPTIQTQSFTSTSASNDQQRSGDGTPVPETTDGNITYENSQGFFFAEVNASASANISYENNQKVLTEPADVIKMDDNFDNTDGTMTYEISENTDGNITYESLENTTDGKFSYEIKQETPEDTEMLTEITGSDNMEDPRDDSNVQDTTVSADDDSVSDECTDVDSEDSSHGDGPGWSLLDQVDPADVVRALTSVRKPVLVHSKCIICNSAMTDNRGLSLHMTIVHKDEREKWCRTCNDLFDDLNEHKEIHAPKCEFCSKTFTFTSHLRSHLKNHARNDNFHTSTWITCKACSNIFPDEDLLSAHECTPDPSKVDHIKCRTFCALCNEAVPVLKYHMKEKHNADGASDTFHLCSACGKSFTSAYQLNIHMRKHTGELPYKCVHCDKSFAARHLMAHHEKLHIDGKLNVCHICSRPFTTNAQLECHLMTHTGKTIKCSQCDKSFCFKAQLTTHMRQHTGEKPHLCTDCGRGFYNKTALASHSRHTHSEDRPYKCSYCDSSFKVKATLKTHEFIHTGLKPFKCTECPYSCRQSYRLTIHMKQHLDENKTVHTCIFCKERFTTHHQLISHTYAHHGEMPLDQLNHLNNLNTPTTTATPNVVNITSHHIIIPDGNNAQTIQIAGVDMLVGGQVICMDSTSRGDMPVNQLGLERMGADDSMDGNVAMDEIDNVPIQIVYKPQEMG